MMKATETHFRYEELTLQTEGGTIITCDKGSLSFHRYHRSSEILFNVTFFDPVQDDVVQRNAIYQCGGETKTKAEKSDGACDENPDDDGVTIIGAQRDGVPFLQFMMYDPVTEQPSCLQVARGEFKLSVYSPKGSVANAVEQTLSAEDMGSADEVANLVVAAIRIILPRTCVFGAVQVNHVSLEAFKEGTAELQHDEDIARAIIAPLGVLMQNKTVLSAHARDTVRLLMQRQTQDACSVSKVEKTSLAPTVCFDPNHLEADFSLKGFVTAFGDHFFMVPPGEPAAEPFIEITLDYTYAPSTWCATHWGPSLYESTIPDIAASGYLAAGGSFYLPFTSAIFVALATHENVISDWYDLAVVKGEELRHVSWWTAAEAVGKGYEKFEKGTNKSQLEEYVQAWNTKDVTKMLNQKVEQNLKKKVSDFVERLARIHQCNRSSPAWEECPKLFRLIAKKNKEKSMWYNLPTNVPWPDFVDLIRTEQVSAAVSTSSSSSSSSARARKTSTPAAAPKVHAGPASSSASSAATSTAPAGRAKKRGKKDVTTALPSSSSSSGGASGGGATSPQVLSQSAVPPQVVPQLDAAQLVVLPPQQARSLVDVLNERFTPLSQAQQTAVTKFLTAGGRGSDVVRSLGGDTVLRRSLKRLLPGPPKEIWLNDEIVHYYIALLRKRDKLLCDEASSRGEQKRPSHYFKSLFLDKLIRLLNGRVTYNYEEVRSWRKSVQTENNDIFELERIIVPHNISESHWCCVCVEVQKKTISYYDSMQGSGQGGTVMNALLMYLEDEWATAGHESAFPKATWKSVFPENVPYQKNSDDCGVFTLAFADLLSLGEEINFTQDDIYVMRTRIALTLLERTGQG